MTKAQNPTAVRALPEIAWNACNAAAKKSGLEPALVRAVCWVESRGQPRAQSPAGAQGLMQLMPATANELGVRNVFDADENAAAGARYLGELLVRFGSIDDMLAAYNWGPANVQRVKLGKVRLPDSVHAYVASVQARWEVEKRLTGPFPGPPPPLMAAAPAPASRGSESQCSVSSTSDKSEKQ